MFRLIHFSVPFTHSNGGYLSDTTVMSYLIVPLYTRDGFVRLALFVTQIPEQQRPYYPTRRVV